MVNYFCFAQNIVSCKMSFSIITFLNFFPHIWFFSRLFTTDKIFSAIYIIHLKWWDFFNQAMGMGFFFIMVRPLTYKDLHSLNLKSLLAPNTCPAKHDKDFFSHTVFRELAQSVAICLAHELQVHSGWQRLFSGQN